MKELAGDDEPGLFDVLVDSFLVHAPAHLDALEAAARNADLEDLVKSAHGLKSSAATMGAVVLADICRHLEEAGRRGMLDGVGALVARAREAFDTARCALNEARG
ncbi:MAG: Hpt domain-containing protein [Planctomycetota bacterium]